MWRKYLYAQASLKDSQSHPVLLHGLHGPPSASSLSLLISDVGHENDLRARFHNILQSLV